MLRHGLLGVSHNAAKMLVGSGRVDKNWHQHAGASEEGFLIRQADLICNAVQRASKLTGCQTHFKRSPPDFWEGNLLLAFPEVPREAKARPACAR
jgi:hypothetical protein